MILSSLLTVVLASLVGTTFAQGSAPIVYDSIHNATTIVGTWSSGSKAVLTGAGFADPANMTFNYPPTTGISYSFSSDGFYEISRYRFNANGSEPTCITGVIVWVHGMYTLNANGSISMVPLGDGFQQVQDPCAATSNFIQTYNLTEYYQSWRIFQDPTQGFKLHMFQFDGSPLAPQFLVSATPNMLPTQNLRPSAPASSVQRRSEPVPPDSSSAMALGSHWLKSVICASIMVLASATLSLV
jgi:hypothetical protein